MSEVGTAVPKLVTAIEDYTVEYVIRAFGWFSKRKSTPLYPKSNGCWVNDERSLK